MSSSLHSLTTREMTEMAEKQEAVEQGKGENQAVKWGTVMQCGATDYWAIGRTKDVRDEYPNLAAPHRLKALDVR